MDKLKPEDLTEHQTYMLVTYIATHVREALASPVTGPIIRRKMEELRQKEAADR